MARISGARAWVWLGLLLAVPLTAGCSDTKSALGIGSKKAPDEFAVYSRAPLSVPPDYGLRPPQPGANRPQLVAPRNDARDAVLAAGSARGVSQMGDTVSPGTLALLEKTGGDVADPSIRTIVNRETSILAEESETFADTIMFWDEPTHGTVIDPEAEAKRIQENQALGRGVTAGDTPIIEKRERGLLEGLFD